MNNLINVGSSPTASTNSLKEGDWIKLSKKYHEYWHKLANISPYLKVRTSNKNFIEAYYFDNTKKFNHLITTIANYQITKITDPFLIEVLETKWKSKKGIG